MPKVCDNKCAGMLVWDRGKLLLVERKKYNFGFAPPAGHLDGMIAELASQKELEEEVGLRVEEQTLVLEKDIPNPCRREGGGHHRWFVYDIARWNGSVRPSEDETKQYIWADPIKLKSLADKLEGFTKANGMDLTEENLPILVEAVNRSPEWQNNPGLEPPWYFILKKLKKI
jgi:ADP-ribose pyrophosphatase YjhB (NUDIX family)